MKRIMTVMTLGISVLAFSGAAVSGHGFRRRHCMKPLKWHTRSGSAGLKGSPATTTDLDPISHRLPVVLSAACSATSSAGDVGKQH